MEHFLQLKVIEEMSHMLEFFRHFSLIRRICIYKIIITDNIVYQTL